MEYRLFLSDLPKRAWENYTEHYFKHDVSALLTVCWAVFVVPVERLDLLKKPKDIIARGSASQDVASGHRDVDQLVRDWESLKSKTIAQMSLHSFGSEEGYFTPPKNDHPQTGRGGPLPGSQEWITAVRGDHGRSDDPKFGDVVKCLRHGLSHANIWTDPPNDGGQEKQIERIVIANYPPSGSGAPEVLILHHQTLHRLAKQFVEWLQGRTSLQQIGAMPVSREGERAA